MSERVASQSADSLDAKDFKNPSLSWMIGFLFLVSFVGLLSVVPLRKVIPQQRSKFDNYMPQACSFDLLL